MTPSDYYRDYYFFKYMNGKAVKEQRDVPLENPRDLKYFIEINSGDLQTSSVSLKTIGGPMIHSYKSCHPEQNHDMELYMNDHRILTKVGLYPFFSHAIQNRNMGFYSHT